VLGDQLVLLDQLDQSDFKDTKAQRVLAQQAVLALLDRKDH
jgi:hypothetical protein